MAREIILSVETATLAGSVAVTEGEVVLAGSVGDPNASHSNTLLSDIDKVLHEARISLSDVDLFAVASGPGSFTGLRIGLATVKGLAETLNRPCAGVPTLHAVALSAGPSARSIALLPAGRGEVFAQLLSVSSDGVVTELDQATHISPQKLVAKYGSLDDVLWCGEGTIANRVLLEGNPSWRIAPQSKSLAREIASLALMRFRQNSLEQPDALRAVYVRPSDAELKVQ